MISQQQWLLSRKKLLRQVKAEVQLRLGLQPLILRQYAKKLDREFSGRWTRCELKDLDKAIGAAHVVLGADFHAYAQSQRAHIRILRGLPEKRNVILALECLAPQQNGIVADFLRGDISEEKFLQLIDWETHWGFPWQHYRPLFELAKQRGFTIVGINSRGVGSLKRRDLRAAKFIASLQRKYPLSLVYVIIGEWHLAQAHLPILLKNQLPRDKSVVTVLQDSEDLYFKLARVKLEDTTECLRKPGARFCIMVSPPWMKWQSYLMYLEQTYDHDLQDRCESEVDYTDQVNSFVRILQRDLKIKVSSTKLNVYGPNSKSTLQRMPKKLERQDAAMIRLLLEHDRSFLLAKSGLLYLSRSTINHAAALSGQFVHAQMCHRQRQLWQFPEDFFALAWTEAVGFFFSKWINPKRKAEDLEGMRLQLQVSAPQDLGRESLLLALELQMSIVIWLRSKRIRALSFRPKQKFSYIEAARILGTVWGEKLYQKVRQGQLSLKELSKLLTADVENEQFRESYLKMIARLYQ